MPRSIGFFPIAAAESSDLFCFDFYKFSLPIQSSRNYFYQRTQKWSNWSCPVDVQHSVSNFLLSRDSYLRLSFTDIKKRKKLKIYFQSSACMPLFQHSNAKRTNGGCPEMWIGFPAENIVSSYRRNLRFLQQTQRVLSVWRQKPNWISGSRSSNSSTASDQFSLLSNNNNMFESNSHERCLAALVAFGKMHINKRKKEDTVSNTYAWDALVYATLNELYAEGTATYDWIFTFQSIIQDIRSRVSNHSKARLS